jgi:hypothetical protein
MAKVRNTPITVEDINQFISSQDDFALELFVYNKLRSLGVSATHGGAYEDPITQKHRQYDLRAWIETSNSQCRIDFPIECKSLSYSFPLLISRIPRINNESYHQVIVSYENKSSIITPFLDTAKSISLVSPDSFYVEGKPVGKSTCQIGKNERGEFISGDSDVFDKWSQALTSAHDLIQNAKDYFEKSESGFFFTCVIPILVVSDETLWVVDYSEDGSIQGDPNKTDEALLYVNRAYSERIGVSYSVSHLHVLTKTGFVKYFDKIVSNNEIWLQIFPMAKILDNFCKA